MAEHGPSYSQLTHDVVRTSAEPLTFDEIMAAVQAIRPITTKNPKHTIRGAISGSSVIIATGDGRFGWKMRLIDGSILRHTLSEAELVKKVLHWDVDVRDALWPTFFANQQYSDRSPALVALPVETVVEMPLVHFGHTVWGSDPGPAFWVWLDSYETAPGDHLLIRVIDSGERWYALTFERRSERDEAAITERNRAIITLGQNSMRRPYGAMEHDITTRAMATGLYQHPVPPDSFGELWPEIMRVLYDDPDDNHPELAVDPLLSAFFDRPAHVYDPDNPPDLAPEYDPAYGGRQARSSLKARKGSVTSFTFRVNHRAAPEVWCDIELAEDQTLEDLHLEIQRLFRWGDDNLYSFFIADETGEQVSEVGSPWSNTLLHTHQVTIGELGLAPGRKLLYLFDYGDNHEFDVEVIDVNPLASKGDYPRTLNYPHNPSQQYPGYDADERLW